MAYEVDSVSATGARKNPRHGATSNGSACRSGRMHLKAGTRQAEPRRARQSVVVAVLRIVTCDVDSAPYRGFFRAPPFLSNYVKGRPRNTTLKTAGGSASPKGEARRERAGKAKRSECRARHAAHSRESVTASTGGGGRAV